MNFIILAVGKSKNTKENFLINYWKNSNYNLKNIIEFESKNKNTKFKKDEESNKMINWLKKNSTSNTRLICFDPKGQSTSSEDFSNIIFKWRNESISQCIFVIGGSYGLNKSLLQKSNKILSFGQNTWPHMLFRIMLLEQIYRAECIISKHPYHRF